MSKTDLFETRFLQHVFQNANIANIGDAAGLRGSVAAGQLFIALFTSPTGETAGGTEATFTGYARLAVARTSGEWNVTDNVASNINELAYAEATAGNETVTHIGVMTAATGGDMLFHAPLVTPRLVNAGTTLRFPATSLVFNED